MMAPKPGGSGPKGRQNPQGKAKAKAKAKANAQGADRKKRQSNMLGQLKNAREKLAKVQAGDVKVTPEELKELQDKHEFWQQYSSLDHRDEKKDAMLEAFSWDKTCSRWMAKTKEVTEENFEKSSGLSGWISRDLSVLAFIYICGYFHFCFNIVFDINISYHYISYILRYFILNISHPYIPTYPQPYTLLTLFPFLFLHS